MEEIKHLTDMIPEKYRAYVIAAVMLSPYITRSIHALMNGRGIKGILSAIWLGTNTPKQPEKETPTS